MKLHMFAARFGLAGALAALTACGAGTQTTAFSNGSGIVPAGTTQGTQRQLKNLRAFAAACSAQVAGSASVGCTNIELEGTAVLGPTTPIQQIPGFHPSDLRAAYKLPSTTAGKGQTIGIVVAYANPNAESDLAVYRATFGLPPCTTQNGCLQIASAKSGADVVWAREAVTDLEMASAICPNCSLVLAEAKSTKDKDLQAAVDSAIGLGATVVSNSYTVPEGPGQAKGTWDRPGTVMVAAAGDQGYGPVNLPAASTNVVAVGATTLSPAPATARGWTESTWSGTGSGCSAGSPKPSWQFDTACPNRTVADVAAVGDPATPVAVYNSYQDSGWVRVGGTSVSAPIVAGVYALAGNGARLTGAASLYANRGALFALTSGNNGVCVASYLCSANSVYSGPAGLGSPNGIAAF